MKRQTRQIKHSARCMTKHGVFHSFPQQTFKIASTITNVADSSRYDMIGSFSSQSAVDDRCLQDDLAVVGDDWNAVITVIVNQVGNAAEFVVLGSHLKQRYN